MPKIVRFHETGAAEVLRLEDLPLTEPGEGEVRIDVEAIGLNRADVLFRQGQYLQEPEPPPRARSSTGSIASSCRVLSLFTMFASLRRADGRPCS